MKSKRKPQNTRGREARLAAAKEKDFRRREIPRNWSKIHKAMPSKPDRKDDLLAGY